MPKQALIHNKHLSNLPNNFFSNNLKILRKEKKLTLQQLADLADLSPSYLSRLEVGSRRFNTDVLHKLSSILGCHSSDLIEEQGKERLIPKNLPIYGSPKGAQAIDFNSFITLKQRPEILEGINTAFGIYINDTTLSPKYNSGETIFVNPDRPLAKGCSAFAITKKNAIIIGQFEGWVNKNLLLKEFSGNQTSFTVSHASLRVVYRIVGSMEYT